MKKFNLLDSWQYFNHNTKRQLISSAIVGLTFEGVILVLFNLYVLRLGYGPEFVGVANGAGLITFAVVSLVVGLIGVGDRVRRLMLIGLVVVAVGALLLPLAEFTTGLWRNGLVIGSNVTYHIGVSFYFVCSVPFVMRNTTGRDHVDVMALESAAFSLSAFTGSVLGGFMPEWLASAFSVGLDSPLPYRIVFVMTAVLLLPAVFAMWGTDSDLIRIENEPPTQTASESNTASIAGPARLFVIFIIVMTLVRIIQSMGMNVSFTFFNVYFDEGLNIAPRIIGLISGCARLLGAALVIMMPRMVRRWGSEPTLIAVALIGSCGILLLGYGPVWWLAGVGQLVALSMNSIRFTLFTSYVMGETPMRWHSLMAGLNETTGGLGFAAMSLLGGFLITSYGYRTLFLTGAILLAAGTLIFWLYVWRYPEGSVPATV